MPRYPAPMAETERTYALHDALPAEVLVGGDHVWGRYRQYPVFSAPWLRGRTLRFALAVGLFALVSAFGSGAATHDWKVGVEAGVVLFVGFLLMATMGPALATWIRHRRWPARRERTGVVLAVLLGIVASYFVDQWASTHVQREVEGRLEAQGVINKRPEITGAIKPVATAVNVGVLVLVYGLLGGGLAVRAYFSEGRRWRDNRQLQELAALRQRAEQADLRLGTLQAQVEPHFLFNTLASVRALVRQDPAMAEATLDALVEHLRATIPKLRDGQAQLHSTLGQQLDICASYLQLMKLRTGGRLSFAVEADPVLRAQPFPPLLLITLVENAVKHGIEPQPGPGRIDVCGSVKGDRLVVSVVDDGAGLQPGIGTGVGLANVREQLATRFGEHAALTLRGLAGRGAVAEISVPLSAPASVPASVSVGAPSGAKGFAAEAAPADRTDMQDASR
jgi:signal transduction histidine kinase